MAEVAVQKADSFWDQIQAMEDRVMRRAHEISLVNDSLGKDLDNWLAAERELVNKPAIELTQKGNQIEIKVAVAGIDPKHLKVEVTEEDLLVKCAAKKGKKEKKGDVYTSEFQYGSLFRSIHLPKKVKPNRVKAELKNGLLTVTAPIADEERTQKAKVQTA